MSLRFDHRSSILGGALFSIIGNIGADDLLRTAILAAVGTLVSYGVTLLMKKLEKKD